MSFFRREEGGLDPAHAMSRNPNAPGAAVTLVAPGSRVEGTVTGATEVRIEGFLAGEVRVEGHVAIGRGGEVEGSVSARTVRVEGTMRGDVRADDRIQVDSSGVAHGDLSAPRVIIAEGAFFKGRVEMGARSGGDRQRPAPGAAGSAPVPAARKGGP